MSDAVETEKEEDSNFRKDRLGERILWLWHKNAGVYDRVLVNKCCLDQLLKEKLRFITVVVPNSVNSEQHGRLSEAAELAESSELRDRRTPSRVTESLSLAARRSSLCLTYL